MAPPPPTHSQPQPLADRLLALARTLQFSWFIGHLTLLLTTLRYTFGVVRFNTGTWMATLSYRLAFMSAAVTYGIVVYKAHRGRLAKGIPAQGPPQQQAMALLGDENVQYLIMAFVWLYSKPIWFALLPFAVYSTFHFLTYLRTNVIPTVAPTSTGAAGPTSPSGAKTAAPQHPISEAISRFVKQNYDTSMHLVSNLEILLWVRIFLGTLVFANSWILLVVYTAFLRVRYAQSQFVRQAFSSLERKGDALVNDARVPEPLRGGWAAGKNILRQIADATNVGGSANGAAGGRKTQ